MILLFELYSLENHLFIFYLKVKSRLSPSLFTTRAIDKNNFYGFKFQDKLIKINLNKKR